jgi:hypothetical protein
MIMAGWTAMLLDVRGTFMNGRTRHVEVKQFFLRELKEAGLIICEWCSGTEMSSDIFTKNSTGVLFEKHIPKFV